MFPNAIHAAGSGLTKGLKLFQTNDIVRCINFVQEVMPIALAQPFVEQVLPEGTKVYYVMH